MGVSLVFGEDISAAKAIVMMKNLEKRFQGIQFTAITIAAPPLSLERTIVYEFARHRYCVEDKSVAEWKNGVAPYAACLSKFSYDGNLFYEWQQCEHGTKFSENNTTSYGMITNNISDSPMNEKFSSFKNGIGIGLPFMFYDVEGKNYNIETNISGFNGHDCMSTYLTEWKKQKTLESIVTLREGVWAITAQFVSKKDIKVRLVVEYDLNKNGFVTNVKYYYTMPNKQKQDEFLANEFIIETIQDSDANWIPTSLRKINSRKDETILFQYKDVKLLQFVSSDMLHIHFPNGTTVSDMANKMEYKVGDIIDEDKAIDDFIRKHNLTGDFQNRSHRGNIIRYILITLGITLIIIGIGTHFAKRSKK